MKNYLLLLLMVGDILPIAAQVKLQSLEEVIKYADSHAFAIQSSKIELQVNESENFKRNRSFTRQLRRLQDIQTI